MQWAATKRSSPQPVFLSSTSTAQIQSAKSKPKTTNPSATRPQNAPHWPPVAHSTLPQHPRSKIHTGIPILEVRTPAHAIRAAKGRRMKERKKGKHRGCKETLKKRWRCSYSWSRSFRSSRHSPVRLPQSAFHGQKSNVTWPKWITDAWGILVHYKYGKIGCHIMPPDRMLLFDNVTRQPKLAHDFGLASPQIMWHFAT